MDYFSTVYENVQTDLAFKNAFQCGSDHKKHKWETLAELPKEKVGLELGQVGKVKDTMGRKALVLSTVVGLVVVYEHIAGHTMLGLTCKNEHLKRLLGIDYGVREDILVMMFGRETGLGNTHRLNGVIEALVKDVNEENKLQLALI